MFFFFLLLFWSLSIDWCFGAQVASDFRRLATHAPCRDRIILDLRAAELYRAGHLPHSSHFPLSDLAARSFELPPPYSPWTICCVGDERELAASKEFLEAKGWRVHEQINGDEANTWGGQGSDVICHLRTLQATALLLVLGFFALQSKRECRVSEYGSRMSFWRMR